MPTPHPETTAKSRTRNNGLKLFLTMMVALAMAMFAALAARAEEKIITAHGISTFGTLKYPADFPYLDYVNPDAPKGGEMSMSWFGSFDSMNPYTIKGRSGLLASSAFESLLTGTADEIGAVYGLVAESIEYPEDRSWVVFNMHPEARFSDGTPLTAEDVRFSYRVMLEKGLVSYRAQLKKKVASVEVLSDHKIRFTFKEGIPTRDLIEEVGGLPIFSKADFEAAERDLEVSSLTPMIGSGPYVLDHMEVGQTLVYRYNKDYWAADLPIMVGHNNFETIRIEYYADYSASFEGFKGGSYAFRNENSSKNWATGYDFPAIENGSVIRAELRDGSKTTGQSFLFNLRRPQFQDARVREAIGLMFNFEWSNKTLFYGLYDRIVSFWGNSYLEAKGKPGPEERAILERFADILPEGVLDSEPVTPFVSSERQLDRKTLRRASALLDAAGWPVGDDGIRRNAEGRVLSIEILNDGPSFSRIIDPYIENLKRLGIDAKHTLVDNAQMTERERPPGYDFDMIIGHMQTGYVPGTELRQYFGSETADESTFNKMGLRSPAVDALTEVVLAAETQETMNIAVKALDRVLRAERFWVPQWAKTVHTVAYFDMYEHPENMPPYALGNLDFWWYNAEKGAALKAAGVFQ
jgi:microcin C transport system substrate-binding protein